MGGGTAVAATVDSFDETAAAVEGVSGAVIAVGTMISIDGVGSEELEQLASNKITLITPTNVRNKRLRFMLFCRFIL